MTKNLKGPLFELKIINRLCLRTYAAQSARFSTNSFQLQQQSSASGIFGFFDSPIEENKENLRSEVNPDKKLLSSQFKDIANALIRQRKTEDPNIKLSSEKLFALLDLAHQRKNPDDLKQNREINQKIMKVCQGNTSVLLTHAHLAYMISKNLGYGAKDVLYLFEVTSLYGKESADYTTAMLLYNGYQGIQNQALALKKIKNLADRGLLIAKASYGLWLLNEDKIVEALKNLNKAAEFNNPHANVLLGKLYLEGKKVAKDDKKAWRHFKKAADSDFKEAFFYLAVMEQQKPSPNLSDVIKYFEKASMSGSAEAQYNLGNIYFSGQGTDKSIDLAAEYWEMASNQRFPLAMMNLAKLNLFTNWSKAVPERGLELLKDVEHLFPGQKFQEDASILLNKYKHVGQNSPQKSSRSQGEQCLIL